MTKQKSTWVKWAIRLIWIGVLTPVIIIFIGFYGASAEWFGPLPGFEELENPESNFASEIYSSDGELLGKYFYENRSPVSYEELSPHLVNALVATEDERFYEHSGIDPISLVSAVVGAATGKSRGGASTISQQLAKMLFTGKPATAVGERIKQKFKEWVIAVRLERSYTKQEIIAMYFNRFDFLNLAVGVKSASRIYFNTIPSKLSLQQAATLVGMAKNPSLYNPKRFPELSTERRNIVLSQMRRNQFLTTVQADSLKDIPLVLEFKKADHNEGIATYFREYLRAYMRGWIKEHPKQDGSSYNLYRDGLRIYTTIDSRMQRYAEEAVSVHISKLQKDFYTHWKGYTNAPFPTDFTSGRIDTMMTETMKRSERYRVLKRVKKLSDEEILKNFNTKVKMNVYTMHGNVDTLMTPMDSIRHYKYFLESGFLSMEPQTGFVKAWVGGIDHKNFKFDHVKKGRRQVGSTFKPFVYATAIDQHKYSPCDEVPNVPVIFEKEKWGLEEDWIPKNSGEKYGGELTLSDALANSVNTVTAYLMKRVGPKKVRRMARQMGLQGNIPPVPSICLGTPDVSLYEMVGAYGTFANKGVYTEPVTVLRIEDKNGIVLDQFQPETREVLSEEKAYVMLNLMGGVTRSGSGIRLRFRYGFKNDIAGKTGTTQNHMDGWFIGTVPNLVSGAWTGCEDPAVRFRTINQGQGANMALPIWAEYMKRVYADKSLNISAEPFEKPINGLSINVDCDQHNNGQDIFDQSSNNEEEEF